MKQEPTAANTVIKNKRDDFYNLFKNYPISPEVDILSNLPLFMRHQQVSKLLCLHELYMKIINVPGVIIEFGVRWGQNLALFESFRSIYEPYNFTRKIIGFDTFDGFPSIHSKDGKDAIISEGSYGVSEKYEDILDKVLKYHEEEAVLYSHKQKFELIKGDATKTIDQWIKKNNGKLISFAYFDFDLYEPTKICLEAIMPHLTKGSIVAFDEINHDNFPGETIALKEVVGAKNIRLQRFKSNPFMAYFIVE
jgi:hypothetical protein